MMIVMKVGQFTWMVYNYEPRVIVIYNQFWGIKTLSLIRKNRGWKDLVDKAIEMGCK